MPLGSEGHVGCRNGGGYFLIPTEEGVAFACGSSGSGYFRTIVLRNGCHIRTTVAVKSKRVLVYLPLGGKGHVGCRNGGGYFLVPTREGVAFARRIGRSGDFRTIVLRNGCHIRTTIAVEGEGVLVHLPLRRKGHVRSGHRAGNGLVPTREGVAFARRIGGSGYFRTIVLRNGCHIRTTVAVKSKRVLVYLPLSGEGHVGCRNGGGYFLVPTREGVAFARRIGRSGYFRTIVLRNGCYIRTAVAVEGKRVMVYPPLGGISDAIQGNSCSFFKSGFPAGKGVTGFGGSCRSGDNRSVIERRGCLYTVNRENDIVLQRSESSYQSYIFGSCESVGVGSRFLCSTHLPVDKFISFLRSSGSHNRCTVFHSFASIGKTDSTLIFIGRNGTDLIGSEHSHGNGYIVLLVAHRIKVAESQVLHVNIIGT